MQRDWDRERGGRTYDEDRSRWGGDYNRDFERGRRGGDFDRDVERGRWGGGYGARDDDYDRERRGGAYGEMGYGRDFDYDRGRWGGGWPGSYGGPYTGRWGDPYGELWPGREYGRWGGRYTEPWTGREGDFGRFGRGGYYRGGYGNERFERGRFVGRGPRGYARSDDRIREDVCDRLTDHPEIDASDIDVRVDNGVVTLSGMVDDRWQRREAEDLAETVSGVRDVQNSIRWSRQGAGTAGTTTGMGGTAATRVGGATTGAFGRSQVRATMDVVGADGDKIGEVKEVRDNDFLATARRRATSTRRSAPSRPSTATGSCSTSGPIRWTRRTGPAPR